jgi:hypothetical protein
MAVPRLTAGTPTRSQAHWHRDTPEADLSLVTCSRCGGSVYEHGPQPRGLEKVVNRVSGCTTYSCYSCGRRGWLRKGRSHLGVAILARAVQALAILFVVVAIAIALFVVLVR